MFVFAMVVAKKMYFNILKSFRRTGALMNDGLSKPSQLLEKRRTIKIPAGLLPVQNAIQRAVGYCGVGGVASC